MRLLAVSGSLRSASTNAEALRAAARLAPSGVADASIALPLLGRGLVDAEGIVADPELSGRLRATLDALCAAAPGDGA